MKIRRLALLVVGALITFAALPTYAALTDFSVGGAYSGTSDFSNATATPEIYMGRAGAATTGACADAGGEAGTSACNNCAANQAPCNFRYVPTGSSITFTFKSATKGYPIVVSGTGSTAGNVMSNYTGDEVPAGTMMTVSMEWGDFCSNYSATVGATCDTETNSADIKVGVSAQRNVGPIIDADSKTIKVYVLGGQADTDYTANGNVNQACLGTNSVGVCSFKAYPGDEKVYIRGRETEDAINAPYFPSTGGQGTFTHIRFYYREVATEDACTAAIGDFSAASDKFQDKPVVLEGSIPAIEPDSITDLKNDIPVCIKAVGLDQAGNIIYWTPNPVASTPSEVVGYFNEENNCFIATAAYGSTLDSHVQTFRDFRDRYLIKSKLGRKFVRFYYRAAPFWANKIAKNETARSVVRGLLWPLWAFAWLSLHMTWVGLGAFIFAFAGIWFTLRRRRRTALLALPLIFGLATPDLAWSAAKKKREPAQEQPPAEAPFPGANEEEEEAADAIPLENPEPEPDPAPAPARTRKARRKPVEKPPGVMRITEDGTYIYGTQKSEQAEAFSFRIGSLAIQSDVNEQGNTFEDIYGSSGTMLFFDYEWQFLKTPGKLGIKLGSGLFLAQGSGRFKVPNDRFPTAQEKFTFVMFPNNASLLWRAQFWEKQYVVPFAEGGTGYWGFLEIRDDFKRTKYGGVPIGQWAAGLSILLDWIDPASLIEMDEDHGINHLWLTAEFRAIYALNDRLDVTNNVISGGFLFEF